eukprot:scaffold876_cov68-Phaeocystis_antarctica.AAC.9
MAHFNNHPCLRISILGEWHPLCNLSYEGVYADDIRLSRRGLGSSKCERDSKTRISAALTSGSSSLLKPLLQAAEPGCSNARS